MAEWQGRQLDSPLRTLKPCEDAGKRHGSSAERKSLTTTAGAGMERGPFLSRTQHSLTKKRLGGLRLR